MNSQEYSKPITRVAHWEDFKTGLRVGVIPCRTYSKPIPSECVEFEIIDPYRCSENSGGTTFVGINNTPFFITNRAENSNEPLKIQVGSGLNPRTLNRELSEISRFNPNIRKKVVFDSCPDGADLVKCVSRDFWKSATSLSNSLECKARLDHINGINEPAENDGYVQFLVGCLSNLRRNTKALNKLLKRDLERHSPGETLEAVRGYDSDKEITLEQEIFTQTLRRLRDYQWHEFDAIRRQFI